jgi:outer membrane protein assembly factor BamB
LLYNRDELAAGPVDRIALSTRPLVGVPAWDRQQQLLLVGNRSTSPDGTYQHGLIAFRIGKDCKLKLAWQRNVPNGAFSGSPVSANGVIYFAGAKMLSAFDAATHVRLWKTKRTFTGPAQTEPIVVNGHVYLSTDSGLYAFGL